MAKDPLHERDAFRHSDLDLWRPLVPVSAFVLNLLLIAVFNWPWLSRFRQLLIWPLMWLYNRCYQRLLRAHLA